MLSNAQGQAAGEREGEPWLERRSAPSHPQALAIARSDRLRHHGRSASVDRADRSIGDTTLAAKMLSDCMPASDELALALFVDTKPSLARSAMGQWAGQSLQFVPNLT